MRIRKDSNKNLKCFELGHENIDHSKERKMRFQFHEVKKNVVQLVTTGTFRTVYILSFLTTASHLTVIIIYIEKDLII